MKILNLHEMLDEIDLKFMKISETLSNSALFKPDYNCEITLNTNKLTSYVTNHFKDTVNCNLCNFILI